MFEGDESRTVRITEARVERLIQAIALAAAAAFDEGIAHLEARPNDDFGLLEEALRMLLGEIRDSKQRSDLAVGELTAAKHELELELATIARQEAAIRELSSPILELWDGILSLPIVGALDPRRAVHMTETLLRRVLETRARWVLIDLTGVAEVDATTADHLIRLAKSLRLVGGRCVLTGICPHVADTFVNLRTELHDLKSLRSLEDGLRYCLSERENGNA